MAAGFSVAPTIRICWENVPEKLLTITDTSGLLIYCDNCFVRSSASIAGVLPTAGISVISGVVIRPSGRTWTFAPNSGLRQTNIVSSSSGPITYSSLGPCCFETKEAGGSSGAEDVLAHPASARLARPILIAIFAKVTFLNAALIPISSLESLSIRQFHEEKD